MWKGRNGTPSKELSINLTKEENRDTYEKMVSHIPKLNYMTNSSHEHRRYVDKRKEEMKFSITKFYGSPL